MEKEKVQRVLWKWDNTLWTIVKETEFGKYIIENDKGEVTKVTKDEVILINE